MPAESPIATSNGAIMPAVPYNATAYGYGLFAWECAVVDLTVSLLFKS